MKLEKGLAPLGLALGGGTTFTRTAAVQPCRPASEGREVQLSIAKVDWKHNSSATDIGVHVSLDGANFKLLTIEHPDSLRRFDVRGGRACQELGMTELS